ncbi:signal recognition particle, SRP9/SRP14 subunit [Viridothelium virens]|uniref:Signal recognition particle subunit SRP14 n=1 Tax=Viridothelium virens TaxID=1048519 RepID=A0A6A6GXT3_VIRVR|nr:signal recognition particle, SRP9/SRP14 subunit [Viridothelium virens]
MHLTNDEFFTRLQELFAKKNSKGKGSVFLKQKRFSQPTGSSAGSLADLNDTTPTPLFIRASAGHSKYVTPADRIQFGTVVQPEDLEAFYTRYAECCRVGMMGGMKKRSKEKKKGKKKGKGKGVSK